MNTNISIRMAAEADAEEILKIYSPYVTGTAITFEYDIPSVTEFSRRIEADPKVRLTDKRVSLISLLWMKSALLAMHMHRRLKNVRHTIGRLKPPYI